VRARRYGWSCRTGRGTRAAAKARADRSVYFDLLTALLFGLIWVGVVAFLRLRDRQGVVYLVFFSVFYVYLFKVLDYTLFQFQSLLLLKYFVPGLMLRGQAEGQGLNLVPLVTLGREDVSTSLLNVLLMVPFGFGLPFITSFRMKQVVAVGMLFSIAIELLQLVTGLLAGITFRVADVDDVIFNTVGVAIGYGLFVGFMRFYRRVFGDWENPLLRYIAERPQTP
jgi:glycopeptide antibiotics resistance protein